MMSHAETGIEVDLRLVHQLARKLLRRMPNTVELEDLEQSGALAYIEAARTYDASQGASLRSYAAIRVIGAMFDEARRQDWVPRSVVRQSRRLSEVRAMLEGRTLRPARHDELMQAMGMDHQAYYRLQKDMEARRMESLGSFEYEGPAFVSPLGDPLEMTERDAAVRLLLKAWQLKLTEREQRIMTWYYNDEVSPRLIGERMGVSESRIYQILKNALKKMRSYLLNAGIPNGMPGRQGGNRRTCRRCGA